MNGLIVFLVIVVISAIIGAVSQVLKNQQQAEQARAAQRRAAARGEERNREREGGRGSSDIDRFLEEIDKLRRKSAEGGAPPVARRAARPAAEVPTVEPPRRPRLADEPARSFPATVVVDRPPTPPRPATPPVRVEDLPVAPVVPPAAPAVARPVAPGSRPAGKTDFGRQLSALFTSPNAVTLGLVLQEVLGPPRCRQHPGQGS